MAPGNDQGAGSSALPKATGPAATAIVSPPKPAKSHAWLALVGCLALALPGLLVEIQRPDVVDPQELATLSRSIHWARWLAASPGGKPLIDLLTPRLNDQPQLGAPPALHWLHMATFAGFDLLSGDVPTLILAGRLVSAALALLTIAAVFWAGYSVGGARSAALGALVCVANPALLYYGRLASPPIAFAAASAVAIAGGLWATRPFKAPPSIERQFIGWVICGLAMGMAMLSHGWAALIMTAGPLLVILVLVPQRAGHVMGLLAAILIAVLLTLPWALLTQEELGKASTWLGRVGGGFGVGPESAGRRLALAMAVIMPWTLWLLGALLQPFSSSSAGDRSRLLLGWLWFVAATVLYVALPATRSWEYILAVVPAGSVLIGQLFNRYDELSAVGRPARTWRILRWLYLVQLAILSLVPLAIMYGADERWLGERWIAPAALNTLLLTGLTVVLLLVLVLSLRWTVGSFPGRALLTWAVWVVLLASLMAGPITRSPKVENPARKGAAAILSLPHRPLYWLTYEGDSPAYLSTLLYTAQPVTAIASDELPEFVAHLRGSAYLLLPGCQPFAPAALGDARRLLTQVLPDTSLWEIGPLQPGATQRSDGVAPAATRGSP